MTDVFEKIANGVWLEGLAVDTQRQRLWYSDVIGGGVRVITADGSELTFDRDRRWTGGLLLNHDGRVLATGAGGIRWHDAADGSSGWLLEEIDGQPINGVNEMAADGAGGIYFGTVDLASVSLGKRPRPTALYHVSREGSLRCVAEIGFTNGIAVDTERRTLFCNDTFTGTWAFTIAPDGSLTDRRLFLKKSDADGMALDMLGNLWVTGCTSGAVTRLAPDGTHLEPFATPGDGVTQLRFGGDDLRDLYLTTVSADGAARLKSGEPITTTDSWLLRTRTAEAGRPLLPPSFALA
jgi:sugar lactone lactonase YvrE